MVQKALSVTTSTNEKNESMSSLDGLSTQSRVMIAVMGQTGTGKTTFVNTASRSNLKVGKSLDSCTSEVQESEPFGLDGRLVTLIDTPGFDDSERSDVDVLNAIATYLSLRYKEKVTLAGVIYIYRISDDRMSGTAKRNFRMFRELCGENALQNVIIVTTRWDKVNEEVGELRERELQTKFRAALEKGARMMRHEHPDQNSAHEILRPILQNHPLPLQIQEELVDQKKTLIETSAGEEVNRELAMKMKKHEEEMRNLQQQLQEAIKANDGESKRDLEKEIEENRKDRQELEVEIRKLKGNSLWLVLGGAAAGISAGVAGMALLPATAISMGIVAAGEGVTTAIAAAGTVAAESVAAATVAAGVAAESVAEVVGVAAASLALDGIATVGATVAGLTVAGSIVAGSIGKIFVSQDSTS